MQICKSILAIQIFKQFQVKRRALGWEFWSDGGHIDTVGDGGVLKKYGNMLRIRW